MALRSAQHAAGKTLTHLPRRWWIHCRGPFFERGPALLLPLLDRLLVALRRAFEGLLPTPAQAAQHPTDVVGMVAHTEVAPDHRGHPFGGPHIATEAMRLCSTDQQARELCPLVRAQPRPHAWWWLSGQRLHAASLTRPLHPLTDRPFTHSQCRGNIVLRPALLLQRPGAFAPLFAPVGLLRCSHAASLSPL